MASSCVGRWSGTGFRHFEHVSQAQQRLRAADSEVEASADARQVQHEELPPDVGMRVPSGDTDDEPDMDPGHVLMLPPATTSESCCVSQHPYHIGDDPGAIILVARAAQVRCLQCRDLE